MRLAFSLRDAFFAPTEHVLPKFRPELTMLFFRSDEPTLAGIKRLRSQLKVLAKRVVCAMQAERIDKHIGFRRKLPFRYGSLQILMILGG